MAKLRQLLTRYKLRLRRKRLLWRAFRKRRELTLINSQTGSIQKNDILLFACLRNEMQRLPQFLAHYRKLGVRHFLIVDNGSDDGTSAYLATQPDVSLWSTDMSYKSARFGMDWLTWLQRSHGHGHWCITADADELLIYPEYEHRDLISLTGWLDGQGLGAMGAMMLDLYPKGPPDDQEYVPGTDPCAVLNWFDPYGYWVQRQPKMGNLWLQGGPRARCFFPEDPRRAPTLNKVPLIKWNRGFCYVNSTHNVLPARLNRVYDTADTEALTGVLLHTKFLPGTAKRAVAEKKRAEHFSNSALYDSYYTALTENPDMWDTTSERYEGWQQLVDLKLMSRGGW